MSTGADSDHYQRGLELAEAGNYQDALACMTEHLQAAPDDAQALNDTGAILHCLGRSAEAIDYLTKAKNLQGECAEIVWNLVEAFLADGRATEAAQLFEDMERMGILHVDVLNRTANIFLNQDNKGDAIEVLLRSLRLSPQQEILRPMIEVIRSKRPRVALFCKPAGAEKSLADIYEFVERRFPMRLCGGRRVDEIYEVMKWSDISWFELATDMIAELSRLPKVCKNIVRLHRPEANDNWLSMVEWESIDTLVTVGNSFVKDALLRQVPDIEKQMRLAIIPTAVNLDKFKLVERRRGKNVACVGWLNMRKNPMLLLQCMQKLHYIDPEYKLFFAGTFQSVMLEQYVRHVVQTLQLTDAVLFDGWRDDMNSWLQDKHYIVSSSIAEDQGVGLLEGMACGLKPIIHNCPGAGDMFPGEFLFNISEEFCEQALSDRYEPLRYRKFVEENYPLREQLSEISRLLSELEAEIDLERIGSSLSGDSQDKTTVDSQRQQKPQDVMFEGSEFKNNGIS